MMGKGDRNCCAFCDAEVACVAYGNKWLCRFCAVIPESLTQERDAMARALGAVANEIVRALTSAPAEEERTT